MCRVHYSTNGQVIKWACFISQRVAVSTFSEQEIIDLLSSHGIMKQEVETEDGEDGDADGEDGDVPPPEREDL